MKKHISLLHSLLLLPLISPFYLYGMEKPTPTFCEITLIPTIVITDIQEEPISLSFINTNDEITFKDLLLQNHKQNMSYVLSELQNQQSKLEDSQRLDLSKSMIIAPAPTKEGLTGSHYAKSFVCSSESIIYNALKDGSFEPNNKTHIQYLENAFDFYMKNNDTRHILLMLEHCAKYKGQIDLNQRVAKEIHSYLENKNNEQKAQSIKIIQEKNTNFVLERNAIIKAFQDESIKRIQELHKQLDAYTQDFNNTFHEDAQSIRKHRKGNAEIHQINPLLLLSHGTQCSDKHPNNQSNYILPTQINNTITDKYLLNKIGADKQNLQIVKESCQHLQKLNTINKQIQSIKLLDLNEVDSF